MLWYVQVVMPEIVDGRNSQGTKIVDVVQGMIMAINRIVWWNKSDSIKAIYTRGTKFRRTLQDGSKAIPLRFKSTLRYGPKTVTSFSILRGPKFRRYSYTIRYILHIYPTVDISCSPILRNHAKFGVLHKVNVYMSVRPTATYKICLY